MKQHEKKKQPASNAGSSIASQFPFQRVLIFAVAAIGLVVVVILIGSAYWQQQQPVFQNVPRLMGALQAFSKEESSKGREIPREVSLQDLLKGGYLTAQDVRAFAGMEVVFRTHPELSQPESLVARARTQDGTYLCLLADGSVQEFSREQYEQERARFDAAAQNAPHSGGTETNQWPRTPIPSR